MPGRGLVMTWGGSAVLAVLSARGCSPPAVEGYAQRLAVVERQAERVAELRAEQRILHGR